MAEEVSTKCLAVDPQLPGEKVIWEAVEVLRAGLPVALPTETVYGLAADALRPEAVARVFEAKARPSFDPLIVHLPSPSWLERVTLPLPASDQDLVSKLMKTFWPGPLTFVLPRTQLIPSLVSSGLPTVAVRMSAHPVFAEVCAAFGRPVAAPSANRFGRISPSAATHVMEELSGRIPLVLDAGPTMHGVESTIVRIAAGRIHVLRGGPITCEQLEEFAPVIARRKQPEPGESTPVAPGMLESHYAPEAEVRLCPLGAAPSPDPERRCALLARDGTSARQIGGSFAAVEILSESGDLRESAVNLFASLRRLDAANPELIVAELVADEGLGFAINDRLRRAAGKRLSA
jgi:L-threonylcarbamoyladenylate synthase